MFDLDTKTNPPQLISAKTGLNIDSLFPAIIERIPPPPAPTTNLFHGFLFDSWYDTYQGVVCLISVKDGVLKRGDQITSSHSGKTYSVTQVGVMHPDAVPTDALYPGQVGYVIIGMKTVREAFIGDTFFHSNVPISKIKVFPGFKQPKAMVFSGLYPVDANDYTNLSEAIERLTLNDASVTVMKESSAALGQGNLLLFTDSDFIN